MVESIFNSLKSLKTFAPEVNKIADEAAQVVRDVEKALDELKLGIGAEVQVSCQNTSPSSTEFYTLQYRRISGKFRIAIVKELRSCFLDETRMEDYALEVVSEKPWAECGRDEKVESFRFIPKLLEELVSNVKSSLEGLQKALPDVRKVLDSLK